MFLVKHQREVENDASPQYFNISSSQTPPGVNEYGKIPSSGKCEDGNTPMISGTNEYGQIPKPGTGEYGKIPVNTECTSSSSPGAIATATYGVIPNYSFIPLSSDASHDTSHSAKTRFNKPINPEGMDFGIGFD
eukprot:TRINITY_DN6667_c0_g1_i1.p1 TRINITY_DN6667_c0_g1~~TRINITY_DN6667_c0_g1_i1.p1  ORF type:complete len:134 (-),score=32.68 TRINITY_DN6667_c0_g1_i1:67-468(-)